MSRLAYALAALLVFAIVLGVAIELVVNLVGVERYRGLIETELSKGLGLEVRLGGELEVSVLPRVRFEATNVTVANLPERPSPYLAEIGWVALELRPLELVGGFLAIESVRVHDAQIRIEPDHQGRFSFSPDREAFEHDDDDGGLDLELRGLQLRDVTVYYDPGGQRPVDTLQLHELEVGAQDFTSPIAIEVTCELDGTDFRIDGEAGAVRELFEKKEPYALRLEAESHESRVVVEGHLADPLAFAGVDLAVDAVLHEPTLLYRVPDRPLPPVGPVHVRGRLRDTEGSLGVEELVIATERGDPLRAHITGAIDDVLALRGVDLDVELETSQLQLLEPLVDRRIHPGGLLSVTGKLSDVDGMLGIDGSLVATAMDDQVRLSVEGRHANLGDPDALDVQVRIEARDLPAIAELLELEHVLPAIGPFEAELHLAEHSSGALGIPDFKLKLGSREHTWVEASGSIGQVRAFEGVHVTAEFGAVDLRHTRAYLKGEPPEVGPFHGRLQFSDHDGTLGIDHASVKGGRAEVLELHVRGSLHDVRNLEEIEAEADLKANDLALANLLFDLDLPSVGPVEFSGRIKGSAEQLESDGTATIAQTKLKGDTRLSFSSDQRPRIYARLSSPHLHFDDLRGETPEPSVALVDWLTEDPDVAFEALRAVDLDLELKANRFTGPRGNVIDQTHLVVQLDDGDLLVYDADGGGVFQGGGLETRLHIDASRPIPSISFAAETRRVDMTDVFPGLAPGEEAGRLSGSVDLRTRGLSASSLRRNLNGNVHLVLEEADVLGEYASRMVLRVIRTSLPKLSKPPRVGCLVVDLGVASGVVSVDRLRVTGDNILLRGSGTVDLVKGRYDLRLDPRPLDPGLVTVSVQVDVTGPLTNPQITPIRRSAATSAVRSVFRNAFGTARSAAELATRSSHNGNERGDCEKALARLAKRRGPGLGSPTR